MAGRAALWRWLGVRGEIEDAMLVRSVSAEPCRLLRTLAMLLRLLPKPRDESSPG